MQALLFCCCGVDIHSEMLEACILKGFDDQEVIIRNQFNTMQDGLASFVSWLISNDCYNVAMESTGVFWRPVYEAIEHNCTYIEHLVVTNAAHMKNLPGRKTDIADAQWIATLFKHGLLSKSFVPERVFRNLREASRLYKKFVGEKARYTNRIMKLLDAHGFRLADVLSDVLCVSGRNILNILALRGSLSADETASCIKGNTKHSHDEIYAAVSGSLNPVEQQMLSLLLSKIDNAEIDICKIVELMEQITLPYNSELAQLRSIPGIDNLAAMLILAEISSTPHINFDSTEKLCSWAGLSPRNDESAGKVKSRKIMPGNPYIKSILCQSAWAAVRSRKNPFAHWFWSRQARLGRKKAIIAVARKMLSLIYILLQRGTFYSTLS